SKLARFFSRPPSRRDKFGAIRFLTHPMSYRTTSKSPFSLREKVRMRGIKSNTCVDYTDPLTPTLSLWERETRRFPEKQGTWTGTSNLKYMFG
ncbi:MAG: hypothetical protein ACREU8_11190, partial [Gammaproteobacteria bacterium]